MSDTDLAQQLIDTVRRTLDAEAATNADRIAHALDYMNKVVQPNHHTLNHLRRILTGAYDYAILSAASKTEKEN